MLIMLLAQAALQKLPLEMAIQVELQFFQT
jgi:hypothetical protein